MDEEVKSSLSDEKKKQNRKRSCGKGKCKTFLFEMSS